MLFGEMIITKVVGRNENKRKTFRYNYRVGNRCKKQKSGHEWTVIKGHFEDQEYAGVHTRVGLQGELAPTPPPKKLIDPKDITGVVRFSPPTPYELCCHLKIS